jgi:chemotaxis protein CheY-P-specific phosphatase CheC
MSERSHAIGSGDLDRVRELTSIGAGHAAGVLAAMLGRPCTMCVPSVARLGAPPVAIGMEAVAVEAASRRPSVGVLFDVEGPLAGVVGLLITADACDRLVQRLLGRHEGVPRGHAAESALREMGNILVSHVVSAMADTLGVALLPSVPHLALEDAWGALAARVGLRGSAGSSLRFETEISDAQGELRARLVFVPDQRAMIAGPRGF